LSTVDRLSKFLNWHIAVRSAQQIVVGKDPVCHKSSDASPRYSVKC